jgi:hypothetical protein
MSPALALTTTTPVAVAVAIAAEEPLPRDILKALAVAEREQQLQQEEEEFEGGEEAARAEGVAEDAEVTQQSFYGRGRNLHQTQQAAFNGSCACWRCPNGTQNTIPVRSIPNSFCTQATAGVVRTLQAVQLLFSAEGGCSEEGAAAVEAAVRQWLLDQRASITGSTTTCTEATVAAAAGEDIAIRGADSGVLVAAVGVSANANECKCRLRTATC